MHSHRVLLFDVETSFRLAAIWGAKQGFIPQDAMVHDTFLVSWAAKWWGLKTVRSDVLSRHEALQQDDSRIVATLADMIREADVIVAHNLDRFDLPVVNSRLLSLELDPVPPFGPHQRIDTLKLARKSFRFSHNNLDYLARTLGLEVKHYTDFDLWKRCYQGDEKALREMVRYNKQDVKVLEQVFNRLLPYVKGLPRLVDAEEENEPICPTLGCESTHLQRRGYYRTNASTFQRYQCQECGRWSRARVAEKAVKVETVPL